MINNLYSRLNYSQVAISLQGCLAMAVYVESQEKMMMHNKIYNKELLKIMGIFIYSEYFLFSCFNAFKINGENETNQWELQNVCEMIIIIFCILAVFFRREGQSTLQPLTHSTSQKPEGYVGGELFEFTLWEMKMEMKLLSGNTQGCKSVLHLGILGLSL